MPPADKKSPNRFTPYQTFVVASLAFLQFAVILDFMIVAPLGALVMPALNMSPRDFGFIVSAYAFSAGASGLLVAGFADRYDRKKLLLFFYTGFVLGTLWCGLANSFHALLAARIVTGIFGGVIGSVVMAIATDLFEPDQRGRVIGFIQTAFAASQILGLPAGIYLSNHWNWHAPFLVMVVFGIVGGLVVAWKLQPVVAHLKERQERSPWMHLYDTVREPRHWSAFVTMMLLATGGFMLMPFGSAFIVNNLGIALTSLPTIYLITGAFTIFIGPLVGKLADKQGKYPVFVAGSIAIHRDGADLYAPTAGVADGGDRRQRGAVRGDLLADDPVPGDVDLGARDDQARVVQRAGRGHPASFRWDRVGDRRPHCDDGTRRQARTLPRRRLRRGVRHADDDVHHVEGEARHRAARGDDTARYCVACAPR